MSQEFYLSDRILNAVSQISGCRIEELAALLPDLTWYQVFREVDRLSRAGQLRLMLDGRGIFTVRSPEQIQGQQALPY